MTINDRSGDELIFKTNVNCYGEHMLEVDAPGDVTLFYFDLEGAKEIAEELIRFIRNHPSVAVVEEITEPDGRVSLGESLDSGFRVRP